MKLKLYNKKPLTQEEKKNKFYKKIKVKQTSSDIEINRKILTYAKKGKNLDLIYISEERLNDPIFMASLYHANPNILTYVKPIAALQENQLFMKSFLRIMVSHYLTPHSSIQVALYQSLEDCPKSLHNMEFVKYIIDQHPYNGTLLAINNVLTNTESLCVVNEDNYKAINNILKNLPFDYLERETLYNKGEVLRLLDQAHPNYKDVARACVIKHGFGGVKNVRVNFLKKNVDLIHIAIDRDGAYGLYQYIMFDLKPNKDDGPEIRNQKIDLRKTFLNDQKVKECLNNEFFVTNQMLDELYK